MSLWERLTGRAKSAPPPTKAQSRASGSPPVASSRLSIGDDGTLTDSDAGLMWQSIDDGVERNQEEALIYCAGLELAGFNDWRLPTLEEFELLGAAAKASSARVSIVSNAETNRDYWTASQGPQADTVYIANGTTMFRTNAYATRAVRTVTYSRRPLKSPQWTSAQLQLAKMLQEFVQKTGNVHGMDLEKKVKELGPSAAPLFRRLLEVDLNGDAGQGEATPRRY